MKNQKIITILVLCCVLAAAVSASTALISLITSEKGGEYEFISLHGEKVLIFGRSLYGNNSVAMVAQGAPHDLVMLVLVIPLLLLSLYLARRGSLKGRLLMSGILGFVAFTYLLYLTLPMYNRLYLLWIIAASTSFFALILTLLGFDLEKVKNSFTDKLPVKVVGGFIIFQATMVALLWLQRLLPSFLNGSVPVGMEHYTTLPVQGLDLAFPLPLSIVAGVLLIMKKPVGYLLASAYTGFLTVLMPTLTGKIIGMMFIGVNPGPPLVIMPTFALISVILLIIVFKDIDKKQKLRQSAIN
ncbi:hypothetical protein [Alkaliphilus serpentinus]|uniref:Uncharacterized protein n=1 Tax=Alkaliphilus serpentinus TaxID=1482731 RepID=A0A833M8F3_9FIRM|nr:hypothetical protein [Alkaliphilus serpentinus]KAB3532813.1 hypothetical protein F8153_01745 [Alkaliphilus serpentinus]